MKGQYYTIPHDDLDSVSMKSVGYEEFEYASFQHGKGGVIELSPEVTTFLNSLSKEDAIKVIQNLSQKHSLPTPEVKFKKFCPFFHPLSWIVRTKMVRLVKY